jgi:hypothetical protein
MKIRVVMFCTLPLVAPLQKAPVLTPPAPTEKTLVAKVIGNAKMHISTKNGIMVPQFVVEPAQTMVT